MHRRQRAVVARVQRLQHVQALRAPHLSHHDPVGAHPQGVADQLADRHLAATLQVRRAGLETDHVALAQPQLRRVLDRHDPLLARDRAGQRVQRRGLAGARAAAHEDRGPRRHAHRQQLGDRGGHRPARHEVAQRETLAAEAPDRQARARQRQRRDDHVDPRPVGQPRVAERRRFVHPPPQRRQHALDRVHQLRLACELHPRPLEPAAALHVHRPRAVHHHLVHRRVREQRLEGAQPRGEQHHPFAQRLPLGLGQGRRLALDQRADLLVEPGFARLPGACPFHQPRAQRSGELVQCLHALKRRQPGGLAPGRRGTWSGSVPI